jgi:hypothetical protein
MSKSTAEQSHPENRIVGYAGGTDATGNDGE